MACLFCLVDKVVKKYECHFVWLVGKGPLGEIKTAKSIIKRIVQEEKCGVTLNWPCIPAKFIHCCGLIILLNKLERLL